MDFSSVVVEDAGKLDRDVAPTDDSHLFGPLRKVQHMVRDDGMLCTLDWQLCGFGARRNQDIPCLQKRTSRNADSSVWQEADV